MPAFRQVAFFKINKRHLLFHLVAQMNFFYTFLPEKWINKAAVGFIDVSVSCKPIVRAGKIFNKNTICFKKYRIFETKYFILQENYH